MATTANETIIPVLAKALRTTFAVRGSQYEARGSEGTIVVRRAFGSTAEIVILDPVSRSAELGLLVDVAEALNAAGFSPDRRPWDVRVDWTVCVKSERRAA